MIVGCLNLDATDEASKQSPVLQMPILLLKNEALAWIETRLWSW